LPPLSLIRLFSHFLSSIACRFSPPLRFHCRDIDTPLPPFRFHCRRHADAFFAAAFATIYASMIFDIFTPLADFAIFADISFFHFRPLSSFSPKRFRR